MNTDGRGKRCLGLALNKKRVPLENLTPSLSRSSFKAVRDRVTKFVNNCKTPVEIRKMSDQEKDDLDKENIYGDGRVDVGEDALDLVTGPSHSALNRNLSSNQNKKVSGHVSFGSLGFMNLNDSNENSVGRQGDEEDGNDDNENDNNIGNTSNPDNNPQIQISEFEESQISEQQLQNEQTPAPSNSGNRSKRRKLFGSTNEKKKSKNNPRNVRIDISKKMKENETTKKSEAAKRGFKNNFLTVKFKLSSLQFKAGKVPDFALFVKDDVHEVTGTKSAKHAGKYIGFVKGSIGKNFFSEKGISYNPENFFMCNNEIDFQEDTITPYMHAKNNASLTVANGVVLDRTRTDAADDDGDASDVDESFDEVEEKEEVKTLIRMRMFLVIFTT